MLLDRATEAAEACGSAVAAWQASGSWAEDRYPMSIVSHVNALAKDGQLEAAESQLDALERRLAAEPPRPALASSLLAARVFVAARSGEWETAIAAVDAARAEGVSASDVGPFAAVAAVHHRDPAVASRWTEEALAATMAHLDSVAGASSERIRISAAARNSATIGAYLTVHAEPEDAPAAYEAVLRWKGQGRAGGGLPDQGLATDDAALLARLDQVRRYIAAITLAPQADAERARDTLARLTREKEGLELRLGSVSDRVATRAQLGALTPAAVCAALDEGTALVDTFAYRGRQDLVDSSAQVAAFVMVGGACDRVHRVELGLESEVAADVGRWRQLLAAHDVAARVDVAGARVRARVWDPLAPLLAGADRVVVIPDASLATLPFPALPVGRGRYLVEDVAFVFAEHAIELTRPWRARAVAGADDVDALLVGGVSYSGVTARSRAACAGGGFGPLPGTVDEVEQIGAYFGRRSVRRLDGVGATERGVREAMEGARVVHLATHGFFSEASCDGDPPRDARADGLNPMILSGLVLAPDGYDDGLLTAEELRSADLSAAQLVVLSACSSGLGSIRPGEGVMGLRRALSMAGAGSVVMSLWAVDDLATRDLMVDLYDALGKRQQQRAPADALRRAQLDALARARATRGDGDPGQWGAFVATGR
jgi:CHAT domain-containing protein